MNREELIQSKEEELSQQLNQWARQQGILNGGDEISVSIKVKKPRKKSNARVSHANINDKDWERILSLSWSPESRNVLLFFQRNGNRATLPNQIPGKQGKLGSWVSSFNSKFRNAELPYRIGTLPHQRKRGVTFFEQVLQVAVAENT